MKNKSLKLNIMELEKKHRQTLLDKLNDARIELDQTKKYFLDAPENIQHIYEMDMFLLTEKIKLIEQGLINNEIDF
jgi:hypothetical protein